MITSVFVHYAACFITIILPALGVSIGQGFTSMAAIQALNLQPHAHNELSRAFGIALALIETAAILSLIVALKLIAFGTHATSEHACSIHYAELGVACAVGIGGCVAGVLACLPARQACLSIARQPFFSNKIQLLMIITQSLMQTPILLGFLVSFLMIGQLESITNNAETLRLMGAGLCLGLGSIGPLIGLSRLAEQACKAIGINKNAYAKVLSFTIVSSALIESAIIFCLVISLFLLLNTHSPADADAYYGVRYLASGIVMGLGTLGVGISSGRLTSQACKVFSLNPELYSEVSKVSIFSQIFIETTAVYALAISVFILM